MILRVLRDENPLFVEKKRGDPIFRITLSIDVYDAVSSFFLCVPKVRRSIGLQRELYAERKADILEWNLV